MNDDDLEFHVWPPTPRGGQHVGVYGAGVLIIHKPTGLAAVCVEERSQLKNKATAMERLKRAFKALQPYACEVCGADMSPDGEIWRCGNGCGWRPRV